MMEAVADGGEFSVSRALRLVSLPLSLCLSVSIVFVSVSTRLKSGSEPNAISVVTEMQVKSRFK